MNADDLHKLNDNAWTHFQDDAMHNAIAAVIDLHQPKPPTEYGTECWECSNPTTWAEWPCATVRAIADRLEVSK